MPALRIQQTDWQQVGETLRKDFLYVGLDGKESEHALRIDIATSLSPIGGFRNVHVAILIRPHFWSGVPDGFLVAQLATTDNPAEVPCVLVRSGTCDDGSLILQPTERDGAETFVEVLRRGRPMQLVLFNNYQIILQLPVPNDPEAKRAFQKFLGAMEAPRSVHRKASEGGFWQRLFG